MRSYPYRGAMTCRTSSDWRGRSGDAGEYYCEDWNYTGSSYNIDYAHGGDRYLRIRVQMTMWSLRSRMSQSNPIQRLQETA